MFFRNLTLYRFPVALDLSDLETQLAECAMKPVGPLELSSRGFVSPLGTGGGSLAHAHSGAVWITVGGEDKLLPGAAVNDLLAKRLKAIEEQEGRKPGGRTRKRLKDELITELLPRALVRPVRTDAILLPDIGLLAVDTASRKVAESVVSEVRRAVGSFPALPINAEVAPRAVLTGWVAGDPLPDGLSLGDECELRDPSDAGAVVKVQRMELVGEEIAKHLESGKQVTRLALTLDDRVSFTLDESLAVRKFKILDGAIDQLESTERDDVAAELDARFVLMAGELRGLFVVLERALKITPADER